jgi:hypothetical protein
MTGLARQQPLTRQRQNRATLSPDNEKRQSKSVDGTGCDPERRTDLLEGRRAFEQDVLDAFALVLCAPSDMTRSVN